MDVIAEEAGVTGMGAPEVGAPDRGAPELTAYRSPVQPPAPPEMAPPGWSAFTPVIPPDPLPFDADLEAKPAFEAIARAFEHAPARTAG